MRPHGAVALPERRLPCRSPRSVSVAVGCSAEEGRGEGGCLLYDEGMPGPARAGLFIYAKDLARLADFYQHVLGLTRAHDTADLVVLEAPGLQLVIHLIPPAIAATIVIASPPERREDTAFKFFFTVPSLAAAQVAAAARGGEVLTDEWTGSGFRVRNAVDPEGIIFQVRELC